MKIITSSIALLSSVFLFGSTTPSNGENAETPEMRDILGKHAPIHRGAGHVVVSPSMTCVTSILKSNSINVFP
jgi:hypothetical protein